MKLDLIIVTQPVPTYSLLGSLGSCFFAPSLGDLFVLLRAGERIVSPESFIGR